MWLYVLSPILTGAAPNFTISGPGVMVSVCSFVISCFMVKVFLMCHQIYFLCFPTIVTVDLFHLSFIRPDSSVCLSRCFPSVCASLSLYIVFLPFLVFYSISSAFGHLLCFFLDLAWFWTLGFPLRRWICLPVWTYGLFHHTCKSFVFAFSVDMFLNCTNSDLVACIWVQACTIVTPATPQSGTVTFIHSNKAVWGLVSISFNTEFLNWGNGSLLTVLLTGC